MKWHRVSITESIWSRLGVRRWELALQSTLGFGMAASSSFSLKRPSKTNAKTSPRPSVLVLGGNGSNGSNGGNGSNGDSGKSVNHFSDSIVR